MTSFPPSQNPILAAFAAGSNDHKNASILSRAINALAWRRSNAHQEHLEIPLKGLPPVEIIQEIGGEYRGLGTGASLWHAVLVLAQYVSSNIIDFEITAIWKSDFLLMGFVAHMFSS